MATKKPARQQEATLPPARALAALRKQLDELQKLKGRSHEEAHDDETKWIHFTEQIIETAFGKPSTMLEKFTDAKYAGSNSFYAAGGLLPDYQSNYVERGKAFEGVLNAAMESLKLQLPEEEIQGAYQPGDEYAFYCDLSSIVKAAQQDIFIVDAYLDRDLFQLYVNRVSNIVKVRILSNKISTDVQIVARLCANGRPLEMRATAAIHDRHVFIDQRGWVIGQSIKDAARKKPTYLVELEQPALGATKAAYESLWQTATVII
jgi:hypothetical protein